MQEKANFEVYVVVNLGTSWPPWALSLLNWDRLAVQGWSNIFESTAGAKPFSNNGSGKLQGALAVRPQAASFKPRSKSAYWPKSGAGGVFYS